MKRWITVLFAVMILVLSALSPSVSAAETTDPQYIYFEVPTEGAAWNNFKMVYCHIWSKTDAEFYPWQSKKESCEDMGNGYWRYDLSALEFNPEGEYSLIFSNETGMQTYNLNITSACKGDIAYCSGDTTVNPVDGEKTCAVARWRNNGDKVHPAIEIDSAGKTLNIDEVNADEIDTVWGDSTGNSYALPEKTVVATEAVSEKPADGNQNSPTTSDGEVVDDGINTNAATIWIICISAVMIVAIIIFAVILAKRNRNKQ